MRRCVALTTRPWRRDYATSSPGAAGTADPRQSAGSGRMVGRMAGDARPAGVTLDQSVVMRRDDGGHDEVEFFGDATSCCSGAGTSRRATVRAGLVVCSPILSDFGANYQREVRLGRHLAAAGIVVQRFHPRGAGHSDGDGADLTLDSMVEDARAAVARLRERSTVETVMVLGTRFGALVAGAVAAEIDGAPVVLWEPTTDPRRFFREGLRARSVHQLRRDGAGARGSRGRARPPRLRRSARRPRRARLFETPGDRDLAALMGERPRPVLLVQIEQRDELRDEYARPRRPVDRARVPGHGPVLPVRRDVVVRPRSARPDGDAPRQSRPTGWWPDCRDQPSTAHPTPPRPTSSRSSSPPAPAICSPSSPTRRSRRPGSPPCCSAAPAGGRRRARDARRSASPGGSPRRGSTACAFSYHGVAESGGQSEEVFRLDQPFVEDVDAVGRWVAEREPATGAGRELLRGPHRAVVRRRADVGVAGSGADRAAGARLRGRPPARPAARCPTLARRMTPAARVGRAARARPAGGRSAARPRASPTSAATACGPAGAPNPSG